METAVNVSSVDRGIPLYIFFVLAEVGNVDRNLGVNLHCFS
jgi:hypothetical protein